jgi:hypothetical protein
MAFERPAVWLFFVLAVMVLGGLTFSDHPEDLEKRLVVWGLRYYTEETVPREYTVTGGLSGWGDRLMGYQPGDTRVIYATAGRYAPNTARFLMYLAILSVLAYGASRPIPRTTPDSGDSAGGSSR